MEAGTLVRQQLSLEVGGNTPTRSTLQIKGGTLKDEGEWQKGEVVMVPVLITGVEFEDTLDPATDQAIDTERRHTGKILSLDRA